MKNIWTVLFFLAISVAEVDAATNEFLYGWKFSPQDQAESKQVDFDDSSWQLVRLPHDSAISGPFDPQQDGFAGKLPWKGVGWYRKEFTLDCQPGTRVYLDFDGVMSAPQVYVNGRLAGTWDYGYTPFRIDLSDQVNLQGANTLAVRVDTTKRNTRWYSGAGIYRKVELKTLPAVHIGHWGVAVTTPSITEQSATVVAEVTVENHGDSSSPCRLECTLVDPSGKQLGVERREVTCEPGQSTHRVEFAVSEPQRWDITSPHLYTLQTSLQSAESDPDSSVDRFGIRELKFTADDGFHLNGRRVQLQGVNLHHDLGPLGAAFNRRAAERQLEIMQDMGINALRTSHNPPAEEVLELCDEMGIVVWDECFDKWDGTADRSRGKPAHEEHARRHLGNLVLRDRNHPSVIAWSIGNEIPNDKEGITPERVSMMADVVRKIDPNRPVVIGTCHPHHVDFSAYDALDAVGWNYQARYNNHRSKKPHQPIIYSESASTLSTRGHYRLPLSRTKTEYGPDYQVSSYDLNSAPWSDIPDVEFELMKRDSFVAGEFVWTGFDYIGEPTPHSRQARSSYFGIVDLCGIPKDRFWLYRSYWRPEEKTIHILPHWNWSGHEGENVPVFVYTNGDAAELFLNGQSLGRREKGAVPPRPENLLESAKITASSWQDGNEPQNAIDHDFNTRWCAEDGKTGEWLQADFGTTQQICCVMLEFEREAATYGYSLQISDDGENWTTVHSQPTGPQEFWGAPQKCVHDVQANSRYLRIVFDDLDGRYWASIREIAVYPEATDSQYYDVTYNYRLRWNDVPFTPGALKVVAYKDGEELGTAEMHTAGEPHQIRLSPDRTQLSADGDDLSFVLVECLDASGNLCPLAENNIEFEITGPAEIAGIGNGNPLSLEGFQASSRKLFYGKAMLILRTQRNKPGEITVVAKSADLHTAQAVLQSQ